MPSSRRLKSPRAWSSIKDDPLLGEFVDILNTPDLTPEALGPKILGLYAKAQEANVAAHVATQEEWQTEVTNDPTIGGDKLDATLEGIERVMRDYASAQGEDAQTVDEALRGAFDITGAGQQPRHNPFPTLDCIAVRRRRTLKWGVCRW